MLIFLYFYIFQKNTENSQKKILKFSHALGFAVMRPSDEMSCY